MPPPTVTVVVRAAGDIHVQRPGRAPVQGWRWDGLHLTHPTGIRLTMTDTTADRVELAVAACETDGHPRVCEIEVAVRVARRAHP